jgi:hypothetical protein
MNCDICGQELISGQRIYRPEPEDTGGGQMVCCSVVCALRAIGAPEATVAKVMDADPNASAPTWRWKGNLPKPEATEAA